MEKDMLEQIQQMITTATVTLRREIVGSLDQKVDGLSTSLRAEMAGMKADLRRCGDHLLNLFEHLFVHGPPPCRLAGV